MFALFCNSVYANAEQSSCIAIADTREQLEQLIKNEKCELYKDGEHPLGGTYSRVFKKDGPLYNCNEPSMIGGQNCHGSPEGIIEVDSREALETYYNHARDEHLQHWDNTFGTARKIEG